MESWSYIARRYPHIKHNIIVPLRIPPAEIYEAVLTYDSNDHELGEVREAVRIYSNDSIRDGVSLRIGGYIKERFEPAISISPSGLNFNLASSSKDGMIEKIFVQNLGGKTAKIISVKSSVDYLVPLSSELDLNLGEKNELQVLLLKEKAIEEIEEEETEEYIYLTIALPVKINK